MKFEIIYKYVRYILYQILHTGTSPGLDMLTRLRETT